MNEEKEDTIYSNIQSKSGLDYYVFCVVRTSLTSRVAAGSNYEVVYIPDTFPSLPVILRIVGSARYWAERVVAGPYLTESEGTAWVAANGNGGIGSIECVTSGTTI